MSDLKTKRIEETAKAIIRVVFGVEVGTRCTYDSLGANVEIVIGDTSKRSLILGKGGRNIDAVRRLMRIWGYNNDARVNIFVGKQSAV